MKCCFDMKLLHFPPIQQYLYSTAEHQSTVIFIIIICIHDSDAALMITQAASEKHTNLALYEKLVQKTFKALFAWVEGTSNLCFTNLSNNTLISHSFHDWLHEYTYGSQWEKREDIKRGGKGW